MIEQCHLRSNPEHHGGMTTRSSTTAGVHLDDLVFDRFLSAWNDHQDLRVGGGSIAQLAVSRDRLDQLRLSLHG